MEFPTVINWTSPFPFKRLLHDIYHFYSNYNRRFCNRTVETLIRRRILWRLNWVCTVVWTLGLYRLIYMHILIMYILDTLK